MEKENNNKLILRFSRMFTSSCKTQDISKVIDHKNPISRPLTPLMMESENPQQEDNSVTKPPLLICKPRCPASFDLMVRDNYIIATPSPRRKITGKYSLLSPAGEFPGRRCPPVSPASTKETRKCKEKKKIEKPHLQNNHPFHFSSSNETDFFSSDDEREEDDDEINKTEHTLFSSLKSVSFSSKSVSFSSDSDDPNPPKSGRVRTRVRNRRYRDDEISKTEHPLFSSLKSVSFSSNKSVSLSSESDPPMPGRVQNRVRNCRPRRCDIARGEEEDDQITKTEHPLSVSFSSKSISLSSDSDDPDPPNKFRVRARNRWRRRRRAAPAPERLVKDSFAVVKKSRNPYSDFRTSMVEMIMEKQIFGSKELDHLLNCFLSLNSKHHHRVILEVFTEICDALFSNCS